MPTKPRQPSTPTSLKAVLKRTLTPKAPLSPRYLLTQEATDLLNAIHAHTKIHPDMLVLSGLKALRVALHVPSPETPDPWAKLRTELRNSIEHRQQSANQQ
jgi:hypothetical protein